MAKLKQTKEDAIRHLTSKIEEGNNLIQKCNNIQSDREYSHLIDEQDNWHNSAANVIRQLFDEDDIYQDFTEEGVYIYTEKTLWGKLDELKRDIRSDIQKLQNIINDINNNLYKNSDMTTNNSTGRTPWDVVAENSKASFILIIILLVIALGLVLGGIVTYNDGKFIIAYNHKTSTLTESSLLAECINQGKDLKKDYIIEDLFMNVQIEKVGSQNIAYVRTTYRVRALKDLNNLKFVEEYSSSYANNIEHVFGSDKENLHGTGRAYDIYLNMKENEVKTILTGCNYYYNLPLAPDRNAAANDILLKPNQEAWLYPNGQAGDIIAKLNLRVESNSLKLRQIQPGARRFTNDVSTKKDIQVSYDEQGVAKSTNRSLCYSWDKVVQGEIVGIYFQWDEN